MASLKLKNYYSFAGAAAIVLISACFFLFAFYYNFFEVPSRIPQLYLNGNEFSVLADSFLHGRLDLWKYPQSQLDCVIVNNKCYWDQGPFPAVILMPMVFLFNLFGTQFYQGYLNFFILLATFFLVYKISNKFFYSSINSLWLAFAFCFASVYLGIALNPRSWYFSQAVAVVCALLAINEYFGKRRCFLIGLFFSFVFATRFTAGLGILFFVFDIFLSKDVAPQARTRNLLRLFIPVAVTFFILLFYNFLRFNSFFDTGYSQAFIGGETQRIVRDTYGLFNIKYFLNNFYYYFIKSPDPILKNGYLTYPFLSVGTAGFSFFMVSPIFVKMFWSSWKNKKVVSLYLASLIMLVLLLLYYNTGAWQFGPRYLLDLLPLWLVLLLYGFPKKSLNAGYRLLIVFSSFVNLFLFFDFYKAFI